MNAYKKGSELAAWDLNPGCRKWINQDSISNRKLKRKLLRQERKKLNHQAMKGWDEE